MLQIPPDMAMLATLDPLASPEMLPLIITSSVVAVADSLQVMAGPERSAVIVLMVSGVSQLIVATLLVDCISPDQPLPVSVTLQL